MSAFLRFGKFLCIFCSSPSREMPAEYPSFKRSIFKGAELLVFAVCQIIVGSNQIEREPRGRAAFKAAQFVLR